MAIISASRSVRNPETILPAAENNLSHSADIGWIVRKSKAILDNLGYLLCLVIQ
jgi:hypothetical protein